MSRNTKINEEQYNHFKEHKNDNDLILKGHEHLIYSVCFSPDGNYGLSGSLDNTLRLWDIKTGKEITTFVDGNAVLSVSYSKNGKFALSGSEYGTVKLWDVKSGKLLKTFRGHTSNVTSVCFSPDNKYVLSCAGDNIMKLWDIESGLETATFAIIDSVYKVITTPDNYYLCPKSALDKLVFTIGEKVFPFEQFDLKYNRADIVLQRIGYAHSELITAYHKAHKKRLKKMNFTEDMLGNDFHIPTIEILSKKLPLSTTIKNLDFKIKATYSKYLLDRINVYVNNVPIYGINGIDLRKPKKADHEQDITL